MKEVSIVLEKAKTDWRSRNQMLRNLQKSNKLFSYYLKSGVRASDSLSVCNKQLEELKDLKYNNGFSERQRNKQKERLNVKIAEYSREISYAKNNLSRSLDEFKENVGNLLGKEKAGKFFEDYISAVEQAAKQFFENGNFTDKEKAFGNLDALWEKHSSEFDVQFIPWKELETEIRDVREKFRTKDFYVRSYLNDARFVNADMATAENRLKELNEKYLDSANGHSSAFSKFKAGFRRFRDFGSEDKFTEQRQSIVEEINGYKERLEKLKVSVDVDRSGFFEELKGTFVNTGLKYEEPFSNYKAALDKICKDIFEGKLTDRFELMFQNDNLDVLGASCVSTINSFQEKTLSKYKETLNDECRIRMIAIRDCDVNFKDTEKNAGDFYRLHMLEKLEYGLNYKEAEKVVVKDMVKKFSVKEIADTLQQASATRIEMDHKDILNDVRKIYFEDKVKESIRIIMNCIEKPSEILDAKTYFQADMKDKIVKETDGLNDDQKTVIERLKWAESETIKDMLRIYPIDDVKKVVKEASPLQVGNSKEKVDELVNGISKKLVEERRAERKAAEREQRKAFEAKHVEKSKTIAD